MSKTFLGRRVHITITDGRVFRGVIASYDCDGHVILSEAWESLPPIPAEDDVGNSNENAEMTQNNSMFIRERFLSMCMIPSTAMVRMEDSDLRETSESSLVNVS